MEIIYWSDYACPYCYIGETRLKKAIKLLGMENDIVLEMKAFQLNPDAPQQSSQDIVSIIAHKYGWPLEFAKKQVEKITLTGIEEGLKFNYAGTISTNTMDAHRLTKYVASKGHRKLTEQIIDLIFNASFSKNLPLTDHQVLMQVAMKVGLTQKETEKVLNSDDFCREVILDQQEAIKYSVNAVPFFLIGKYELPGAVSVNNFIDIIQEVILEEKKIIPPMGLNRSSKNGQ